MLGGKDGTLLRCGDMGIDFCDMNRTVTKHFLNVSDVHVCF